MVLPRALGQKRDLAAHTHLLLRLLSLPASNISRILPTLLPLEKPSRGGLVHLPGDGCSRATQVGPCPILPRAFQPLTTLIDQQKVSTPLQAILSVHCNALKLFWPSIVVCFGAIRTEYLTDTSFERKSIFLFCRETFLKFHRFIKSHRE